MSFRKEYEGWSNERMDDLIKDRSYHRISDVDRALDKVVFECDVCQNQFSATPSNINLGNGCPTCRREKQKGKRRKAKYTHKEVVEKCRSLGWELLEEKYINSKAKMKVKCIHCDHVTEKQFRVLLGGHTICSQCGEKK